MKTALIIGISGNFGYEMALALMSAGWQINALMRDPAKAPGDLPGLIVHQGDASSYADVAQAAEGIDLLVYAANPPYHRWQQQALAMLEPSARVAEKQGLQLLFPGNVYAFASQTQAHNEQSQMLPPTAKGEIRLQMEKRLQQAAASGAQVTVIRAGDFIGAHMDNSWLNLMLKQRASGCRMQFPHEADHQHYWSFLPDLCHNAVLALAQAVEPYEVWHDPGFLLSQDDWQQAFERAGIPLEVKQLSWWPVQLAALLSPMLREVMKMRYLWQQPLVLDGHKLTRALGADRQVTPLADVVRTLTKASAQPVNQTATA